MSGDNPKITLKQLAQVFNVSSITISRALGNQDGVSDELKSKIVAYAKEVGYLNADSSRVKVPKAKTVLLLIPDVFLESTISAYISFYKNIISSLEEENIIVALKIIDENEIVNNIVPKMLSNHHVDGIILLGEVCSHFVYTLANFNVSLILLDFYDEKLSVDCVLNANFLSSYEITKHLIDLGHMRISFVGTVHATHSIQDRYMGYQKAIVNFSLPREDDHIINDRVKNGEFIDLVLPDPLPSAFVCNCDEVARRLIDKLKSMNISVPEDCSVVAFDNTEFSTNAVPHITTMASDLKTMTKACVQNIINKMLHKELKVGVISIKGNLIERDSVRDLRLAQCYSSDDIFKGV